MHKVLAVALLFMATVCSAMAGGRGGHSTTWDPNLFGGGWVCLKAAVPGCSQGFNATCNGVADDTAAYNAFLTYAVAQTSQVKLYISPGACRIIFDGTFTLNVTGNGGSVTGAGASVISNFLLWGYGASIDAFLSFGFPTPIDNVGLIQTTNVSDSVVTLITASDSSKYTVGDWVCVCGLETQHGGFPPNFQFYEYRIVTAINAGTGVLTLNAPLTNRYFSTWPLNDVKDGPAAVWLMLGTWNSTATIYGITVVGTGNQFVAAGKTVALYDITVPDTKGLAASANQSFWTFFGNIQSQEVDKAIEFVSFYRISTNSIASQSPSPNQMLLDSSTVTASVNGTPKNLVVTNSIINGIGLGPSGFGHGVSISIDSSYVGSAQQPEMGFRASWVTFSNSTFAVAKTDPNRFSALAHAVPFRKYCFASLGGGPCDSIPLTTFTITAVREDTNNFYFDTDIGNTLPTPSCNAVTPCTNYLAYAADTITQTRSRPGSTSITQYAPP